MKTDRAPLVSIVVLNWNGLKHTKVCLEHVQKLDYQNYEVVIVDNGSSKEEKDYLRTYVEKHPGTLFVDNPTNRGFTGGHIDGLAQASGEYIVLLNNDAVMKKDYLKRALQYFKDPKVAVVGGRSYFWNEQDGHNLFDETNPYYSYQSVNVVTGEAFMQQADFGLAQEVNNVSGSCVVVRRSVIEGVGYLYDRFFAYFEETDLFARFKRAGYKVLYSPDLQIWHRNGASTGSGSYFFYYRIFRNRFIFAMRNFETTYLWRFCYRYVRISLGSLARVILLRKHNRRMHKAYAQAAWSNAWTFPLALASRLLLQSKLGKSRYNHLIYREQTGVSIVLDCTNQPAKQLEQLAQHLAADNNPLHEYVLVTKEKHPDGFGLQRPNLRFVVDRGYFKTSLLNLGCLAARFDWMAIGDPANPPDTGLIDEAVTTTLSKTARIVGLGTGSSALPVVLLHKEAFLRMGGIGSPDKHRTLVRYLIRYGQEAGLLAWHTVRPETAGLQKIAPLSTKKAELLKTALRRDRALLKLQKTSLYGKLKNRFSRFAQVMTLIHWAFMPSVTLYLKGARIKNLLLFSAALDRKKLALELKHIRNEVILRSRHGLDLPTQHKVTKQRLHELGRDPSGITVFIICRDRVDALKKLIRWLESNNLRRIVLIDNDSVYPPLLEYLAKTPYQVIRLYRNVGHTSPWSLGIVRSLVPEDFYIISDPDVIPIQDCPDDVLQHFLHIHKQFFAYQKVGFGLRIDDLPNHYPLKESVIEWESQFWFNELHKGLYEAGIDTTFAMYKPYTYTYTLHPSIRTGFPYVARHLPWYANPKSITEEEAHYRYRADHNVSSWNTDALKDRYAKEMKKPRRAKVPALRIAKT